MKHERVLVEVARLISAWGAGPEDQIAALLERALEPFGEADLRALRERIAHTGEGWGYQPPDPVGRAISRVTMRFVLKPESTVLQAEALELARHSPVVLLGNHLSLIDVNVLDHLLAEQGFGDVAERITALVGPKVFLRPIRTLASLCFGTIKLPQSQSRASEEAVMSARETARFAVRAIHTARQRQSEGDHLLIFPEGTRSRSRALERLLPAVARYLELPGCHVVPWAHWGSEALLPIDDEHVRPSLVTVRMGKPIAGKRLLDACGERRALVADVIGFLLADLLPESYRGVYARESGVVRARELADALQVP